MFTDPERFLVATRRIPPVWYWRIQTELGVWLRSHNLKSRCTHHIFLICTTHVLWNGKILKSISISIISLTQRTVDEIMVIP